MDVTQNIGIDLFIGIGAFNAAYTRTYTRDGLLEDPDNVSFREALSEGKDIEVAKDLQRVHDPHDESDEMTSDEVELHVNLGQVGFVFIEANVKNMRLGVFMAKLEFLLRIMEPRSRRILFYRKEKNCHQDMLTPIISLVV